MFMGPFGGLAEQVLELGEDLFDRVEVGAVGRQEQEACADAADSRTHSGLLVARQVVHDDDVTWRERGYEALLDVIGEALAVDWLVEHAGRVDPVAAKCCKEGHRPPVAIGHLGVQPLPLGCPAA